MCDILTHCISVIVRNTKTYTWHRNLFSQWNYLLSAMLGLEDTNWRKPPDELSDFLNFWLYVSFEPNFVSVQLLVGILLFFLLYKKKRFYPKFEVLWQNISLSVYILRLPVYSGLTIQILIFLKFFSTNVYFKPPK